MADLSPPPAASPPPAPSAPPARRRRRIVLVTAAVVVVLVGAIAVAAIVTFGRDREPRHRYEVTVFLEADVTAEQKAAVEPALRALHPVDGVRFESREQAWARFRERFKDKPDLVASTKAESMPQSFRLATTGRVFDCAALAPVRQLPGVNQIVVVQVPAKDSPGATVECP
jgi:cell division protein FtsX